MRPLSQSGNRVGFHWADLYQIHARISNQVNPRPMTQPLGLTDDPYPHQKDDLTHSGTHRVHENISIFYSA